MNKEIIGWMALVLLVLGLAFFLGGTLIDDTEGTNLLTPTLWIIGLVLGGTGVFLLYRIELGEEKANNQNQKGGAK